MNLYNTTKLLHLGKNRILPMPNVMYNALIRIYFTFLLGLTFDWIENIVYWSDSKSISLYSVGSGIVNKVIDNVENPSYLTVCPYHK